MKQSTKRTKTSKNRARALAVSATALAALTAMAPAATAGPQAPSLAPVTNLRAVNVTDVDIDLAWDPPADSDGGISYALFFDGSKETTTFLSDPEFNMHLSRVIGWIPGSTHTVQVRAEEDGEQSWSETLTVSFLPGDNAAPTAPSNLRVVGPAPNGGVEVAWDPSTDESEFRYEIFDGCTVETVSSATTHTVIGQLSFCGHVITAISLWARDEYDNVSERISLTVR